MRRLPGLAVALAVLAAACSGSGEAPATGGAALGTSTTRLESAPATTAPAAAEAADSAAALPAYEFPRNHPARYGLAGVMRVEQRLTSGDRSVSLLAETAFQPEVGFECTLTVEVGGTPSSVSRIVWIGDLLWLDNGLGFERNPAGVDRRQLEEACGPGQPFFTDPSAGGLALEGAAVDDPLGETPAQRIDLDAERPRDQEIFAGIVQDVGLFDPEVRRGTAWVVDRWLGRLEVAVEGSRTGPLGDGPHDYEVIVTFSALGAGVTVTEPEGAG